MAKRETILIVKPDFAVDDIVYLKTDTWQEPAIVIAIIMDANGYTYRVRTASTEPTEHFNNELSTIRDMSLIPKDEDD